MPVDYGKRQPAEAALAGWVRPMNGERVYVRASRRTRAHTRRAPRLNRNELLFIAETMLSSADYDPKAKRIMRKVERLSDETPERY